MKSSKTSHFCHRAAQVVIKKVCDNTTLQRNETFSAAFPSSAALLINSLSLEVKSPSEISGPVCCVAGAESVKKIFNVTTEYLARAVRAVTSCLQRRFQMPSAPSARLHTDRVK